MGIVQPTIPEDNPDVERDPLRLFCAKWDRIEKTFQKQKWEINLRLNLVNGGVRQTEPDYGAPSTSSVNGKINLKFIPMRTVKTEPHYRAPSTSDSKPGLAMSSGDREVEHSKHGLAMSSHSSLPPRPGQPACGDFEASGFCKSDHSRPLDCEASAILVKDVLFEPVRKTQDAMYFFKAPDGTWMPCGPKKSGAIQITMQDLTAKGLAEKIIPPLIARTDFEKVLGRQRPTVSKSDLEVHERFTKEFGEEG